MIYLCILTVKCKIMKRSSRNPYTGRQSPGFRFCFHVRAIAYRSIFLPLIMKQLPQIRRLLKGESPLTVFNCSSFQDARNAFSELRKKFDFAYWAVSDYHIRDINDADRIVPLRLNSYQHYLIDTIQKRHHNRQTSRYVITKTFRRCGLTTCVQAYITWLQTYKCYNNSYTCSSGTINLGPLETNLCRLLKRDVVPPENWIYLPKADRRAFFNTFRSPDYIRGINLGYVHFADMSRWKDPDGVLTSRTFCAATSAVLLDYFTLVVLEGNIPKEERFRTNYYQYFHLPFDVRIGFLRPLSNNPWFLDYVAYADSRSDSSGYLHINLDHTFDPARRIKVPLCPPVSQS